MAKQGKTERTCSPEMACTRGWQPRGTLQRPWRGKVRTSADYLSPLPAPSTHGTKGGALPLLGRHISLIIPRQKNKRSASGVCSKDNRALRALDPREGFTFPNLVSCPCHNVITVGRLTIMGGIRQCAGDHSEQRAELTKSAQSRTLPAGDVFRARLILAAADG
jgi:hypothetical protein